MEKEKRSRSRLLHICLVAAVVLAAFAVKLFAAGEDAGAVSMFYGKFWSLLPPVVAIVLALVTKEVYLSLFAGILVGGLLSANLNPIGAFIAITEGFTTSIADELNAGILIFLVVLGAMVALINKAGGSAAYGKWASEHIKSQKGAMLATVALGVLIFVDDYFNCLTVGSVMRPVTDKFKVSRAKLSYLIDATAAPVCIIAPISSWAAAVTASVTGDELDGFKVFLMSIPYNYYAILSIVFIAAISAMGIDYGPMLKAQQVTDETGDIFSGTADEYADAAKEDVSARGRVYDLVIPVVMLIVLCIAGMVSTGGFFQGVDFITAFANSDASMGLALGSLVALALSFVYFVGRRLITIRSFAASLPDGFRQMVPAMLILVFAWTLGGFINDSLGASVFVERVMSGTAETLVGIMPAAMFLVACLVAFATGASWSTFGILIPIAQAVFPHNLEMLIITIAASMAGAVFGDHCSPIADTTIMASAGAQVNHILHVSTQMPYAITVAVLCFISYLIAGFVRNVFVCLIISLSLLAATLVLLKILHTKQSRAAGLAQDAQQANLAE